MSKRPGGVTFAGWLIGINGVFLSLGWIVILLAGSNTRVMIRHGFQHGAAWIQGLVEVVVLVGLWGTPGAQEFFRSPAAIARPAPPPLPPRPG